MTFVLDFHPLVQTDLAEAADWYARVAPEQAERFLNVAQARMRELMSNAPLYRPRLDDIRRLNFDIFPHAIFYFIAENVVVILGVLHGMRDTDSELRRRRAGYE